MRKGGGRRLNGRKKTNVVHRPNSNVELAFDRAFNLWLWISPKTARRGLSHR